MVYSVTSLSHFVLYPGASNVRADNYTVGSLILLVGCLELNILYWSALSWHKLSLTLATAHYSSLDNAVRLIAAYLTTVCQVTIKIFYLHMKRLATTLKMFIFTINCLLSWHVYITSSDSRVARSVCKFPPMPTEFTLCY